MNYKLLEEINSKPKPFQFYTAEELWNNDHISKKMLEYHLNEDVDISSRRKSFIDNSIEWIISHFGINESSVIIDFGCGPGLYTSRLAITGADITGIDFSKRSIEYAKDNAPASGSKIDYVNMNYLDFNTEKKYDLIIMIMCDYCALSPVQRKSLLQIFNNILKPNGDVLLDVYTLNAYDKKAEQSSIEFNSMNNFWSENDYYAFINIFKYDNEKVTLDKYTVVEKDRTRIIYNWLQYYSLDTIRKEVEENKLKIAESFSDVKGSPFDGNGDEMAVVIKKR